ncbi:MAG: heptosyltransferase, partial [Betaproteobacteria bacterium]|nr:heptosyltransferase [Betaproteobacteria bacterium]
LVYTPAQAVRYGISAAPHDYAWFASSRYAVLIHATSADAKLWPEERWTELGRALHDQGITSVLPWGNGGERERSVRLSRAIGGSVVPPRLDLREGAALLAQAACVVGVDTGLTHLAAALGARTVGIYCGSEPALTGIYGAPRAANLGGPGRPPSAAEVLKALT